MDKLNEWRGWRVGIADKLNEWRGWRVGIAYKLTEREDVG